MSFTLSGKSLVVSVVPIVANALVIKNASLTAGTLNVTVQCLAKSPNFIWIYSRNGGTKAQQKKSFTQF